MWRRIGSPGKRMLRRGKACRSIAGMRPQLRRRRPLLGTRPWPPTPTSRPPKGDRSATCGMVWGFAAPLPGPDRGRRDLALLLAAGGDLGRSLRVQADHRQRLRRAARAARATSPAGSNICCSLVGVMALATAVRFYFVSWLGERTVADIRLAVHRNLLRLSPGFFEENRPAEITSRITVDTTIIEQVVGTTVSVALRNVVLGIACVVILFALAPKLAGDDAARRPGRRRVRSSFSAAGCAQSRRAARTASPTSARSPAKCSAR